MEDYDEVLRAVGHFTHRHGRIDRFESLNEYWLSLEASLRTDFNIPGIKRDFVDNLNHKSRMKKYFHDSGVRTVQAAPCRDEAALRAFVEKFGYPVIVKPDQGCGASFTYKLSNEHELVQFIRRKPLDVSFIAEEFVDGIILTYDGLVDGAGVVRFAVSHRFDQSVMDVVNNDDNLYYICQRGVAPEVAEAGRRILKAFDVRERFFHIELFQSRRDGGLIALEVNMRPPGAWMTDAINFSYDTDVYRQWAFMVVQNRVEVPREGRYFTAYASRKDWKHYAHTHDEILRLFGAGIVKYGPIEPVFSRAMGNFAYQFRHPEEAAVREFVRYVQELV
jgi:biotin carboxylase